MSRIMSGMEDNTMTKIVKNPRRPDDWDNPWDMSKNIVTEPLNHDLLTIVKLGLHNAYEQGADDLLDKVIRKNGSVIL